MAEEFKGQVFYEISGSGSGWSEVWYNVADSARNMLDKLDALSSNRVPLLGNNCTITFLRASNLTGVRQLGLRSVNYTNGLDLGPADMPWTAAKLRLEAGDRVRSIKAIRGLPDAAFTSLQSDRPQASVYPPITDAWFTWVQGIIDGGWSLRRQRRVDEIAPVMATDIICDPASGNLKVTAPGHIFGAGNSVTLWKWKSVPQLAGRFRIHTVVGDTFLLAGTNLGTIGFLTGFVRDASYVLEDISRGSDTGTTKRNVGRPFGLSAGRA